MNEQQLLPTIGAVWPFATLERRDIYIKIGTETAKISPVARRDTPGVQRALYEPGITRTIMNCSSPQILAKLRNPVAVMTMQVNDPAAAAVTARRIFAEHNISADVMDSEEVELGIAPDFMYFVVPSAGRLVPILFWPLHPDPKVVERIPKPEAWD